ncbi:MAG: hypothetical protein J6T10_25940 [Methanobrevibacter sp.]|nr:hypothetical protein [Methanobrevibacter sp.]
MKNTVINTTASKVEVTKALLSNKSMKDYIDKELTIIGVICIYDDEKEQKITMLKTEEYGYIATLSEKTFDDVAPSFVELLDELESFKVVPEMIQTKNGRDFITYNIL